MLQSVELGLPAILLSSARFDQQPDEAAHRGMNLKEEIMAHTLYGHLFSTKTLIHVGFAVLSLYAIGTAFAQGVPAGTMAPMYGTTWAAARAQAQSLNAQTMAPEASKTAQTEAPRAAENKSHLPSHRTGG